MKRYISFFVSLVLSFFCYSGFAQNAEMEDSLNKLIDELHELGAKQNPEEIDYIPPLTEEEFNDLVEYSKSLRDSINSGEHEYIERDNENSEKLSFSEYMENHPTIAQGTSLIDLIGLFLFIIIGVIGIRLRKKRSWFAGTLLISFILTVSPVACLLQGSDFSYYPVAWAVATLLIFGTLGLIVICLYLYGVGTILNIHKRSRYNHSVGLLNLSLMLCSIFPPLFIIPIIYYFSKWKLVADEWKSTVQYQISPIAIGLISGLILSIPFKIIVSYLGLHIREVIYYIQYLYNWY